MRIETRLRKIRPFANDRSSHADPPGGLLRAAREGAGLTLKEAAALIGYSWVAVERWELGRCLPKPGVLWHLRQVYGVDEEWAPRRSA
jgi:transcriptional regulator with XRE-family HTH domain